MAIKVTEDAFAEKPALEWLAEAGWGYRHGAELVARGPSGERNGDNDVVLAATLRRCVSGLNPQLPTDAIERVITEVTASASPRLIDDHREFHELLLSGVPISWIDPREGQ